MDQKPTMWRVEWSDKTVERIHADDFTTAMEVATVMTLGRKETLVSVARDGSP